MFPQTRFAKRVWDVFKPLGSLPLKKGFIERQKRMLAEGNHDGLLVSG